MIPRYGIEGRVKLGIIANDPGLERFPADHRIKYAKDDSSLSIRVFDKVRVRIWVRESQGDQRELVLDLIDPKNPSNTGVKRKRQRDSESERESDHEQKPELKKSKK